MAPEQAMNRADIRSDVYSLGATLYALITGRPPFPGKTRSQKLLAHQLRAVRPLQQEAVIPDELSGIVLTMLAKKPEDRFQTPAELIEALAPWGPVPEPDAGSAGRTLSRRPWGVPVMVAVLVTLAAAAFGGWRLSATPSPSPPSAPALSASPAVEPEPADAPPPPHLPGG
jgi:serine/threonine protein kinase